MVQLGKPIGRHIIVTGAQETMDSQAVKTRLLPGLSKDPFIGRLAWLERSGWDLYPRFRDMQVSKHEQAIASRHIGHDFRDNFQRRFTRRRT